MPNLEDYFARVDAHLAQLDPDNRTWFLEKLSDQWAKRYADFQARVARGAPVSAGVTSFDFIDTIAALDQRAARHAAPTSAVAAEVRAWQRRKHLRVIG